MTATEILRRMMDERGVEYRIDDAKTVMATKWDYGEHSSAMFTEYDDGECVFVTSGHTWTPEQAIAATLGAGTCHVWAYVKWDWDRCEPYWEHDLSCGHTVMTMEPVPPRYCPNCGRKVVDA